MNQSPPRFYGTAPINPDFIRLRETALGWTVFCITSNSAKWPRVKLAYLPGRDNKANFWLNWNGQRFAGGPELALLRRSTPELEAAALAVLARCAPESFRPKPPAKRKPSPPAGAIELPAFHHGVRAWVSREKQGGRHLVYVHTANPPDLAPSPFLLKWSEKGFAKSRDLRAIKRKFPGIEARLAGVLLAHAPL